MLLRSARLADGRLADVRIEGDRIAAVAPTTGPDAASAHPGAEDVDLDGFLLLPAPVEPHAHLDKALSADIVPNPAGDLLGAIDAWMGNYPKRTVEEIIGRARRMALRSVAFGCTAIRTNVDVNEFIGLRAAEAVLRLRDELADIVDIQLVALASEPLTGDAGATNRRLLAQALELGVDVGGGCPHIDSDPYGHLDAALDAAGRHERPLDLHMDENLEPDSLDICYLASRIVATGFAHPVVAAHCTSLGMLEPSRQADIAAEIAAAGITVTVLPQTNLYLQARGRRTAQPRGLTAVAALLEAGVNVSAGTDNVQDPFNVVGRGDPFETAALLVMAGHLTPDQAYHAVSTAPRRAMGLEPVAVEQGSLADLIAVRAGSLREAVASAPTDRIVVRRGQVVARTTSSTVVTGRS